MDIKNLSEKNKMFWIYCNIYVDVECVLYGLLIGIRWREWNIWTNNYSEMSSILSAGSKNRLIHLVAGSIFSPSIVYARSSRHEPASSSSSQIFIILWHASATTAFASSRKKSTSSDLKPNQKK